MQGKFIVGLLARARGNHPFGIYRRRLELLARSGLVYPHYYFIIFFSTHLEYFVISIIL